MFRPYSNCIPDSGIPVGDFTNPAIFLETKDSFAVPGRQPKRDDATNGKGAIDASGAFRLIFLTFIPGEAGLIPTATAATGIGARKAWNVPGNLFTSMTFPV